MNEVQSSLQTDDRVAPPPCVIWWSSLPTDTQAAAALLDDGERILARAAELGCDPRERLALLGDGEPPRVEVVTPQA